MKVALSFLWKVLGYVWNALGIVWKAMPVIVVIALVIMVFALIKMQCSSDQSLTDIQKSVIEMKELQDEVVRNQAKFGTKEDIEDLAKKAKVDLTPIIEDLADLKAEIKGMSLATASSTGYTHHNVPSDNTTPGGAGPYEIECSDGIKPCPDPYGYLTNAQIKDIHEKFANLQVPLGQIEFRAWEENPWSVDMYQRDYNVTTVIGQDDDGRHYVYSKLSIDAQGKSYNIPIEQAEFIEKYPESKLRFNPQLYLGVDVGSQISNPGPEIMPNLSLSFLAYGRTKAESDWTFLDLGIGYAAQAEEANLVLSPLNYNIGNILPLVSDLHVGPTIGLSTSGNIFVGGGIRTGL